MLHWLYNPNRPIKRFVDENSKPKPATAKNAKVRQIMELAAINGMRPSDVDSLAASLDPKKLTIPQTEHDRLIMLEYMINILLDDLNLDSAEEDFLKDFGVSIGYPIEKVPLLVREVYNGMKNENTESEIKEAVNEVLVH
jgi:hypothetical protein